MNYFTHFQTFPKIPKKSLTHFKRFLLLQPTRLPGIKTATEELLTMINPSMMQMAHYFI